MSTNYKPGWAKLATLVKKGHFTNGVAESDEGTVGGYFAGPISEICATPGSVSVSVSPCMHKYSSDWELEYPEGNNISSFNTVDVAEPSFETDGSVSWYIYLIGTVTVYPKGHPRGEELRQKVELFATTS